VSSDHFEASFVLGLARGLVWERLTERPLDAPDGGAKFWIPGFDSPATAVEMEEATRWRGVKDDEPCAGTEILVALADEGSGTRITVVQSGFGDWLPARYDMMAVGRRHIVADLETYLVTGVHARRHFRPWGDLGADVAPAAGGLAVSAVRPGTLAHRLGLTDDDVLVVLAGAPVSTFDDLVTVLRVLGDRDLVVDAEWVRDGGLCTSSAATG
jgi:hypothetical protein